MQLRMFGIVGAAAVLAAGAGLGAASAADKPITDKSESIGSAVVSPAEDLNIKRTKIPASLMNAQVDPYTLRRAGTCAEIAEEVGKLDVDLGPDYDVLAQQGAKEGSKLPSAGDLVKAGVAEVVPFRGLVRQLSGAAQHEALVDVAIDAGIARRAFLKGRAMEMNCAPPASPVWFQPKPAEPSAPVVAAAPTAETATAVPVVEAAPAPTLLAPN